MNIKRASVITTFLILIAFFQSAFGQSFVLDQLIGVIANKAIKESDIEVEYKQLLRSGYSSDNDMKCMIAENMVKQKMLLNQAMLDSIPVSESQIESQLTQKINANVAMVGEASVHPYRS